MNNRLPLTFIDLAVLNGNRLTQALLFENVSVSMVSTTRLVEKSVGFELDQTFFLLIQ